MYKKIFNLNKPINDIPAQNGPKFGYSDLENQCSLDFKAFGDFVATDQNGSRMCGGHCATSLGLKCPTNKDCKNDKDCEDGLSCNGGLCQSGKAYPADGAITLEKCTSLISNDPGTVGATGFLSGTNKPCGGYCAAYFGIKCPKQQKCKVTADCETGWCDVPSDSNDSFGYCGIKEESEGPKNSDLNIKELIEYNTVSTIVKFLPKDIDPSSNDNIDNGNCQSLTPKLPEMNPSTLDKDKGEALLSVICEAIKDADEIVINDFSIPDVSDLNKLGTIEPKILIARIIKTLIGILGSIALVMFIYGGILFMTDAGNSERTGKAKEILIWTSLGLAVIFASYAIVNFIFEAFK